MDLGLLVFIFSVLCIRLTALPEGDIRLLLQNKSGRENAVKNLKQLSSRDEAIKFLEDIRDSGRPFVFDNDTMHTGVAARLLTCLGDRVSIEAIYRGYLDSGANGFSFFGIARIVHPELIDVLGPDLSKNSEKVQSVGELNGFYVPFANAILITNSIIRSGFFSSDVEGWAKGLQTQYGWDHPERYLEDVRRFWSENADKIKAKQYDLVRPPSVAKASVTKETPSGIPAEMNTQPAPEQINSIPTEPKKLGERGPISLPDNHDASFWPWIIAVGGMTAAAG